MCYRAEGNGGEVDAGMVPAGEQEERADPQTDATQHTVSDI